MIDPLTALTWVHDGFEQTADGLTGEWSLIPHVSPVDSRDVWIVRGRASNSCGRTKKWRYFGAFETLESAQVGAAKLDEQRVLYHSLDDSDFGYHNH